MNKSKWSFIGRENGDIGVDCHHFEATDLTINAAKVTFESSNGDSCVVSRVNDVWNVVYKSGPTVVVVHPDENGEFQFNFEAEAIRFYPHDVHNEGWSYLSANTFEDLTEYQIAFGEALMGSILGNCDLTEELEDEQEAVAAFIAFHVVDKTAEMEALNHGAHLAEGADRLAKWILNHAPDEIGKGNFITGESAIDVALRMLSQQNQPAALTNSISNLTAKYNKETAAEVLVNDEYPFKQDSRVLVSCEGGDLFGVIHYSPDLAAWMLLYFSDDTFTEPLMRDATEDELAHSGKDMIARVDFLYEVGFDGIELFEDEETEDDSETVEAQKLENDRAEWFAEMEAYVQKHSAAKGPIGPLFHSNWQPYFDRGLSVESAYEEFHKDYPGIPK